jgi:hypothetical protein
MNCLKKSISLFHTYSKSVAPRTIIRILLGHISRTQVLLKLHSSHRCSIIHSTVGRQPHPRQSHENCNQVDHFIAQTPFSSKMNFSNNAFASNASQNCGNVISDRSSTRLHAPPGGKSSMGSLIFGGSSAASDKPISSNRFASGSNQNCGNVITDRSSTRLHAPPGGSSEAGSLIFGGGATDQRAYAKYTVATPGEPKLPMQPLTTDNIQKPSSEIAQKQQTYEPPSAIPQQHRGVSANVFANGVST